MEKEIWDSLWGRALSFEEDLFLLAKLEMSVDFDRISKIVISMFGSFEGLKVIELGAGSGKMSLLFAKRGANVTVLDYSDKALARSKQLFERYAVNCNLVLADVLNLDEKLRNRYDVSMSFGLAEHFRGKERMKVIEAHFDVIKKNGLCFISTPSKMNVPYRIWRFITQISKEWEEYPFSRREYMEYAKRLNPKEIQFIGGSIFPSNAYDWLHWLRFLIINKCFPFNMILSQKLEIRESKKFDLKKIKKEKGTFLDQYVGYALVLVLRK
ncbi:MAG: class I SAM-dependent methyltransferase [Candidatus Bathyarchaeota archaeon]|nr:class I SAM-dependent methyltransferase [Candidatus Bathyarchaeota archaeon]MDH5747080.1 class I SAM-dependent methyltransferase [Candidatus Bathyarchaeota archaeon]